MLIDLLCLIGNPTSAGTWSLAPTSFIPIPGTFSPTLGNFETVGNAGTYIFQFDTSGGCTSTSTATVVVNPSVDTITITPSFFCGDPTSLSVTITGTPTLSGAYQYTLYNGSTLISSGTQTPAFSPNTFSIPLTGLSVVANQLNTYNLTFTISNSGTSNSTTCGVNNATCTETLPKAIQVVKFNLAANSTTFCATDIANANYPIVNIFPTDLTNFPSGTISTSYTGLSVSGNNYTIPNNGVLLTVGTYTVTQTVTYSSGGNTCVETKSATITVTAASSAGTNATITVCN